MLNKYMIAALALLAVACIPAHADSVNLLVDDSSGMLGYVNVDTGAVTLLGNSGVALTDIAFSPTGALYGVNFSNLYSINTTTGHASEIGPLGDNSNALVFSSSATLYSAEFNFDTVNPGTGQTTLIGSLTDPSAGDLAFVNGQLYLATSSDHLAILNTVTGAETIVGETGVENLFGLASPDGKTLYGVAGTDVYLINASTGAATFLVNYGGQGLGQANGESFLSEAQTPPSTVTPEPSTWVLLASGLLLLMMITRSNNVIKMTAKR